ncbi:hypothetical protein D9M72_585690 [compost metagenome]
MLEQRVIAAGRKRQDARALVGRDLDGADIQGVHEAEHETRGDLRRHPFAGAAERLQNRQPGLTEAAGDQQLGQVPRAGPVRCQRQHARARMQVRPHQIERTSMH